MESVARTRAEVEVLLKPQPGANIVDRLPCDCLVEILGDNNRWYQVRPLRMVHAVIGYLPQTALIFPFTEKMFIFPQIIISELKIRIASVPPSLKLSQFLEWLDIGGKPAWISTNLWNHLSLDFQDALIEKIKTNSVKINSVWDSWLATVNANKHFFDTVMDEWNVVMSGGREVYAVRDHAIFMDPSLNYDQYGWALRGQIMRWNGNVCSVERNGSRRNYYEVDFYRLNRYMHGWFRADIAANYIFPAPDTDPAIESNSQTVFNLKKSILRHPQDKAIDDAKKKGYKADQYIDVISVTQKRMVHFSLCGEFCVAAICGKDVLPILQMWVESKFWRVHSILDNPHEGTSVFDLQSLLTVTGMKSEIYSSIPTAPQNIQDRLNAGQRAIVGCGINSTGKIKSNGNIRHWVVLEDIIPVGNSGWARVYNPFLNREEVYNYNVLLASAGAGAGLWVFPPL